MYKFVVVLLLESGAEFTWAGNADDDQHAEGLAITESRHFCHGDSPQDVLSVTPCTMYKTATV